MFEVFPMDFKEEVAKSLVDIAANFNFKNPKESHKGDINGFVKDFHA